MRLTAVKNTFLFALTYTAFHSCITAFVYMTRPLALQSVIFIYFQPPVAEA